MTLSRLVLHVGLALSLSSCATVPRNAVSAAASPPRPSIFVAVANPLAAEAGMAVLRRGGSAADAAVAVQAMLSLVEPQSSGLGGGAFMTWYDGRSRAVTVYDGREVAPTGATPEMFLDATGQPLTFSTAVVSGRATGVPGVVRLLAEVQREHGALAWRTLFAESERTAREGFVVSPRLGRFLTGSHAELTAPDVLAYFARPGGGLLRPGDSLRNPAYAEFLRRLATQGPDALYDGETARRIVEKVHAEPLPGTMTREDLAAYRLLKREPVCGAWHAYLVCAPPPPASGVGILQLLGILQHTDIATRGPTDPQAWYLFAEASRLMYADRDRFVGDPAFVQVPVEGMLDPAYLAARARLIGERAGEPPVAGEPPGAARVGVDGTLEPTGTSHFVVGDGSGNVVSMTTTVESLFGSGRMVDGFFLNNQMTDFSFRPRDADGRPAVNAVAPGKRPRSTMTPLVLLDRDRRFVGTIGSAGGTAILAYIGKSLVAAVDWRVPMQDALALPNLIARGANYQGEVDRFPANVLEGLTARGITLKPGQGEDSGVQAVLVRDGQYEGGYDPRREGRFLIEPAPAAPAGAPAGSQ